MFDRQRGAAEDRIDLDLDLLMLCFDQQLGVAHPVGRDLAGLQAEPAQPPGDHIQLPGDLAQGLFAWRLPRGVHHVDVHR